MTPQKPPAGLRARGRAFWARSVAEFELSHTELELLTECCRLLDEIDQLRRSLTSHGTTVAGSKGQPRTHPALGELRQHRLALGRLLAQLALPDEGGATLPSALQARGRAAATARWGGRRG